MGSSSLELYVMIHIILNCHGWLWNLTCAGGNDFSNNNWMCLILSNKPEKKSKKPRNVDQKISIGNSMICSDIIWHKYHKWYFKIVLRNLRQFRNITSGNYAKYHVQIMLLIVYTTTLRRFVIFTSRYFKLSWNTTAVSQSNCRNFSCSSITMKIWIHYPPILPFKIISQSSGYLQKLFPPIWNLVNA